MAHQARIGYYEIESTLGTGGMGTVYLANHTQIGRQAAIKGLKPQLAVDLDIRARFKNEAALMAKLHHPNIVDLYDYVEMEGNLFLIMEYVQGVTLERYVYEITGPLTENQAKRIFAKILDAFAYAHQSGIVHRDIKPANIMITQTGDIKIMDFGIAKMANKEDKKLTQAGVRLGTLFYMSPEQIRAAWNIDARSDIFSLGITLFEVLTGSLPYPENMGEYDLSQKIVNEPLPRLKDYLPEASEHMQKIIDKATAKNPEDRFQSAEEFKKTLLSANLSGKSETEEEHLNQVVWNIQQEKSRKPVPKSVEVPPSIPIKETTPDDKPAQIAPPSEKETLLLQNYFGIVSNRRVQYYKNKDLFEKGKKERLYLSQIIDIEYNTRREVVSGVVFLLLASGLFLAGYFATYLLAISLLTFSLICFMPFPVLTILKTDQKKARMKAWPWHLKQSKRFLIALRSQLSKRSRK